MINTFSPFDFEGLLSHIRQLLNKAEHFIVICMVDMNDQVHHWKVIEGEEALNVTVTEKLNDMRGR